MHAPNPFRSVLASSSSIGIDIGSSYVKVAQVKEKNLPSKYSLSFAIKEIKNERSREQTVQAIKEACGEARIDSNKANLSIYGPDVIMRYITFPCIENFDLSKCLEFELEKYIPGKQKSDMVIDYKTLYRLPSNQMMVLLIALERRILDERVSLVKEAGLAPWGLNLDSLALMNTFKVLQPPGTDGNVTAILDIGYSICKLVVFQEETPYFSRDIIGLGFSTFVQLICEKMSLDPVRAQQLIVDPGDKIQDLKTQIKPKLDNLLDELRLSFEYCVRNLQKKVNQLYLCGGGSKPKALSESIEAGLNLKTSPLDITGSFTVATAEAKERLKGCYHLLPVAVGLAIE